MALRRLFQLFCCLLAWNSRLPAQTPPASATGPALLFRNLDNTSGLISDEVFSVTQDKDGYIWIGTLKGLQRYDGFRFRNFIDSGYQLTNDGLIVTSLYADSSKDRLMYNQFNQEMKERTGLDHRAGTLLPEKEFRLSAGVAYTGAGGERWLSQLYFLSKTSANGRVSEGIELIKEPYLDKPYFAFFFRDKKTGKTWVTEPRHGLLLFDDSTHRVIEPNRQPDQNPLFSVIKGRKLGVRKIQMDHNGDIWLVDWSDKILRMTPESATLQTYDLSKINRPKNIPSDELPVWATSVLEDNHGVIWVGTAHAGLLRFQADSNRFTSTLHRPGDALSLQYNHEINNLFQDKEENIWVATDKGVSFFNPYQQEFIELDETDAHPDNLPRSEINGGLVDSNGNFLVVYWGGGIRLYNRKLELKKTLHFPTAETNLLWGAIRADDGTTWVACQHGYLHLLDKEYNLKQTLHPAELENSTIRCMAKDHEGNLYFGLHNGKIVRWNAAKKSFSAYLGSNLPRGMTLSSILYLFIDRQNRCWAGTNKGLALFDPEKRNYTAFFRPDINMPTPCHGIEQVNDSMLATGLENAGLYFLNIRSNKFSRPPGANSSFETSVYAVKKDSSGNIWFTTDYDICRYNPQLQVFSLSSPERGYLRAGFEGNYFIPAVSGNWFSWTKTEMIGFDPATLIAREKAGLPVNITGFSVFDKPFFIDSLLKNRLPIELSYQNNFIAISFSNLLYSSAARTRYFYRLVGVDKDWVAGGPQHQAAYTGLVPGKYRFEVTTESVFNTKSMTSFDLVLSPPFWQTSWFRALSLLLIIGIIFLVVSGYIRNIRRESDMKQQIVRTEMMALRAQMNPHFIFNCINSIDALIQSDDKYLATVYLNKFAKLIRNILDSSKETTITLKRDLETLQLYVDLERFRNRDNFSVDIRADEQLLQQDFKIPPLIIQPYVENAIHHGLRNRGDGGGKLTIDISRQQDQLVYVIEDNGVGRNAAGTNNKKYRSYGMEMSLDRLKLFNQQSDIPVIITDLVENGKAAGTRVEVSLHIK